MKATLPGAACSAAVAILTMAAFAQTTPQFQTAATVGTQDQQVTVVGCVQREADYRRAQNAGRGRVAGTGVGVANEFILAKAWMSTTASAAADSSGTSAG